MDGLQRIATCFRHINRKNNHGEQAEAAEEEIRAIAGVCEEDRGYESNQPVGELFVGGGVFVSALVYWNGIWY